MNRREFMKRSGLGAGALALSGAAAAKPRKQPNVVLVMTDDQGYGDLACHGNPHIKTPNLDALHGESLRLTNFHVDPTCSPTRSALMTGRYSIRTGVWHTIMGRSLLRRDETTMADVFRASGYRTGIFGKWHLGDNYPYRPQDRGFEEVLIHGGGGVGQAPDFWGNTYFDDTYFRNGEPEKHSGYCTDVWFDAAMDFIEANAERPFFAYLPTNTPHGPYRVPEVYAEPYRNGDVPNADFYGMVTNIDENVGRLVKRLKDLGLEEDTILIFMTDNGSSGGSNLDRGGHASKGFNADMRGKKGMPYDGGHRVPCFIRWPGGDIGGAKDVNRLTAHIDLLPTLIGLCGLEQRSGLAFDGTSLEALLQGNANAWPDRMLFGDQQRIDYPEKWRNSVVMTEQWRLIHGKALFDVQTDPGQKKDVAGAQPEVAARLRDGYEKWWASVSEHFDEYCPIVLGSERENPVQLSSMDWHGPQVPWNQEQVRKGMEGNGFWAVDVEQAGTYEFALRRWPEEAHTPMRSAVPGGKALPIKEAKMRIGDAELEKPVSDADEAAVFQLELETGETRLQTWLTDERNVERGAYYVYVRRLR